MNLNEPSTPKTLVESVHRQLRRDIIEGRYQPGSKLRVEHLKELYGVGGGTCRVALTLLLSDSLVTAFGQRGFRVAQMSYEDFADITNTRILIEVEAMRQSLAHGDENWETAVVSAFHRLTRAEEKVDKLEPEAMAKWEQCNQTFHEALIAACPSRWVRQFAAILYQQSERYRRLLLMTLDSDTSKLHKEWPRQKKEHADIFEAALKRDIEHAVKLLTNHIGFPLRDFKNLPAFVREATGKRASKPTVKAPAKRGAARKKARI